MRFCMECGQPLQPILVEGRQQRWCPSCRQTLFLNPKLAVAVIVGQDGLIVLGRRGAEPGRGRWSFPAGYVDQGERVEDAACREVREEVGLDIRLTGLVGLYSEPGDPVVLAVYAGHPLGGTLRRGSDMQEVGWFSLQELPPLAFQRDARILEQWRRLPAPLATPLVDTPLGVCDDPPAPLDERRTGSSMMHVTVELYGPLQGFLKGGRQRVDAQVEEGATVLDLLAHLGVDVSQPWNASVNGTLAGPSTLVPEEALVLVFPPIAGG